MGSGPCFRAIWGWPFVGFAVHLPRYGWLCLLVPPGEREFTALAASFWKEVVGDGRFKLVIGVSVPGAGKLETCHWWLAACDSWRVTLLLNGPKGGRQEVEVLMSPRPHSTPIRQFWSGGAVLERFKSRPKTTVWWGSPWVVVIALSVALLGHGDSFADGSGKG